MLALVAPDRSLNRPAPINIGRIAQVSGYRNGQRLQVRGAPFISLHRRNRLLYLRDIVASGSVLTSHTPRHFRICFGLLWRTVSSAKISKMTNQILSAVLYNCIS